MLKVAYALIVGLFGAGIVHIAVVLMVPKFVDSDAWSRLAMAADLYRVVRIDPEPGRSPVMRSADPLFSTAACRFDLSEAPVEVHADGKVPYWSVSVYDRGGQNIYSFNDRTAADGVLDFAVLTPAQMVEARKDLSEETIRSVFVEAPIEEGIVVIRVFVPDQSWRQIVSDYLDAVTCEPM